MNHRRGMPETLGQDYWIPTIRWWGAHRRKPGEFWRLLFITYDWFHAWVDQPRGSLASVGVIAGGIIAVTCTVAGVFAFSQGKSVIVSPPQGNLTEVQQVVERSLPVIDIK
ncbi:MAG: hypothetical protein F6J89_21280 [Symploca sp. SIO1C4]|uniref:Uncharacterized protein n=1 Tax=Symploca sp. SIO1C4 TaxID=2607765 RepID=A0A6B3NKF4_9CYAN|nr:hypothetical protein [Symploca sp. SIO1C4]